MKTLVRVLPVFLLLCQSVVALASVQITVTDQQGQPLEDAVIELLDPANIKFAQKKAEVKQQDLTFIPFVSALITFA